MKIGILVTGPLSDEQKARHGTLPDMFVDLLSPLDPDLTHEAYAVHEGEFPADRHCCDGWIVTGSVHSAYEQLPWMLKLEAFIRDCIESGPAIVGICFGHQIMATAMGGVVRKQAQGLWGAAVQTYRLALDEEDRPGWMQGTGEGISLQASHQDQVTGLPPGAKLLGGNDFCPFGILGYGEHGLSMQLHPELRADFIESLLRARKGQTMSTGQVDEALQRVHMPVDDRLVAGWIMAFLRSALSPHD